ncbi:MAG: hypothetical protein FJW30_19645 [Acidobacteria bacterium]|nr:hypothetical protein [Acidobacteriota bacterium]
MPKTPSTVDQTALYTAALEGLEAQKQRIEEQIRLVKSVLSGRHAASSPAAAEASAAPKKRGTKKRAKRVLSAEARKRIADAQKKRWANYRKEKE